MDTRQSVRRLPLDVRRRGPNVQYLWHRVGVGPLAVSPYCRPYLRAPAKLSAARRAMPRERRRRFPDRGTRSEAQSVSGPGIDFRGEAHGCGECDAPALQKRSGGASGQVSGRPRQAGRRRHRPTNLARLMQHDCNRIARTLNRRPRKRLGYRTPEECYVP